MEKSDYSQLYAVNMPRLTIEAVIQYATYLFVSFWIGVVILRTAIKCTKKQGSGVEKKNQKYLSLKAEILRAQDKSHSSIKMRFRLKIYLAIIMASMVVVGVMCFLSSWFWSNVFLPYSSVPITVFSLLIILWFFTKLFNK